MGKMAILNNIVKIKNNKNLSSQYIEEELLKLGFENVLRWSIVEIDDEFITVNFSSF